MFDRLMTEVRGAAGVEPGGLSDPAVSSGLVELAGVCERADAALLLQAAVFVARGLFELDGAGSARSWLVQRSTLSSREAASTVKAARLLARFERLAKLLSAGEVSAGHVRVLARFAIGARMELVECDIDLLCDLALQLRVDDYAVALARWSDIADDVLGRGEPEDQFRRRGGLRCAITATRAS
jgi:hypothetical protein